MTSCLIIAPCHSHKGLPIFFTSLTQEEKNVVNEYKITQLLC